MKRDDALAVLRTHHQELAECYGLTSLALFGSLARNEASPESDVDILAEFPSPPTFDQYMGLKLRLEDLLGASVDLVTRHALKARVRPHVEAEAVRVA